MREAPDGLSRISFVASLAQSRNAISISGTGDGARIHLDIPETHAEVVPLLQMYATGRAFVVHIMLEDGDEPA